jgi:phosphoglycolate phosphatase-like HAD superfamily hydrolase
MSDVWAIVFDWDGTLINSLDVKVRNAGQMFAAAYGISDQSVQAAYRRYSGIPRRRLFDAILSDFGLGPLTDDEFSHASAQFTECNLKAIQTTIEDDVLYTLKTLRQMGHALFISSSAIAEEICALAVQAGIAEWFVEILGSRDGFAKGPQHIQYIRASYPDYSAQIAFVGDEPVDIALGKQSGLVTIARLGTHLPERFTDLQPDYMIAHLSDLIPLFQRKE